METRLAESIIESLKLETTISGHTHTFYNYPARFSPEFVRSAIINFSDEGDCIIDPFLGSGTTAVESLALGRKFFGIDINPIATFLARSKTTPLSKENVRILQDWRNRLPADINLHKPASIALDWDKYTKHIPWWVKKLVAQLTASIDNNLKHPNINSFARATLLATGQWALDCKTSIPSSREFVDSYLEKFDYMLKELLSYQNLLKKIIDVPLSQISRRRKIITRSVVNIDFDRRLFKNWVPAKLILTSPPYPGVHVVYNRWQVLGRKETPAPYWIINSPDGYGLSYYSLGDRKQKYLKKYFENLREAFNSITSFVNEDSTIIQLVGFSDPSWQLEKYLEVMDQAGYREIKTVSDNEARVCRQVPNRKWYAQYQQNISRSSKEFLLIHKLK